MRVFQINTVCGQGSTGRIVTDIYKILAEKGHECKIAYGRGSAPEGIDSYRIGSVLNNYSDALISRIFDNQGFNSKIATKRLVEEIKAYNPDIIQLHNLHGYYLNLEILFDYLRFCGKKIIWTLHDCWAFTGHCTHFDYIGCDRFRHGCCNCPQKNEYPKSSFIDNSKGNWKKKAKIFLDIPNLTIVTPSKWLKSVVCESFLSEYPVKVIYNGIDLELFKPTKNNFKGENTLNDKKIVLGVSNQWTKRKGYDTFLNLSKKLSEKFAVVMVGLTKEQITKLPNNIIGLEKTDSITELAEIYTAADIFVNASVEETMGLTTIEALSCGTPVVVFNSTALPEIVNESCGMVVEKDNFESLKQSIENFDFSAFLQKDLTERAKKYDKKTAYLNYLSLYEERIN